MSTKEPAPPLVHAGRLKRSVGFYGLMMVSLGSIIGSGWLLGALNAAERAGPASVLSWILAAGMLSLLALVYAELGATYPVAGGAAQVSLLLARLGRRVHGGMGVVAAGRVHCAAGGPGGDHLRQQRRLGQSALQHDLQGRRERRPPERHRTLCRHRPDGGVHRDESGRAPSSSPTATSSSSSGRRRCRCWRSAWWPRCSSSRRTSSAGGGFMPFGFHGVFAALTGGVVFGLQGFEQAVHLAGEARDPKRDLSRAILAAMADRRRALRAVADRDDWRAQSRAHRQGLVDAARHRSVRLRRLVHAGAGAGRGMARQGAPHRRRHFTGGHGRRVPGDHGPALLRARRRARDAERAGHDQEGRAGRLHRHGGGRRPGGVWTVQELERPRQRGDRRDGHHVFLRAAVAGGAAQGPTAAGSGRTGCRCQGSCCRRPSARPT